MKSQSKKDIPSEYNIFRAFLCEYVKREGDSTQLEDRHYLDIAFDKASKKFPQEMSSFEFQVDGDRLISPTLSGLFIEYSRSGIIKPNGIDTKHLGKPESRLYGIAGFICDKIGAKK